MRKRRLQSKINFFSTGNQGVDFINILRAQFLYEILAPTNSTPSTAYVQNFGNKNSFSYKKRARKTLMKLTEGSLRGWANSVQWCLDIFFHRICYIFYYSSRNCKSVADMTEKTIWFIISFSYSSTSPRRIIRQSNSSKTIILGGKVTFL